MKTINYLDIYTRAKLVKEYHSLTQKIKEECKKEGSLEMWLNGDNTINLLKKRKEEITKILGFED